MGGTRCGEEGYFETERNDWVKVQSNVVVLMQLQLKRGRYSGREALDGWNGLTGTIVAARDHLGPQPT